jgi:phosphoribosyl 1,2-cyclic phosphate phosphodiesterase
MELIFLGTGTSQGVPVIAQRPDMPIDMQNPKNWRTRSSVHVVVGGLHIQIDAAQEMRLQCIREKIPTVDLFILTHGHADHILGMDDLRRYCEIKGESAIPVYATPTALDRVRAIFPYAVGGKPLSHGYPAFDLHEVPREMDLPQCRIETTLLPHGKVRTLGIVITEKSTGKRLAYYTDCKEITPEAEEIARHADIAVIDALRPRTHPTHMNTEEALAAAERIKARTTYFTHLTCEIDHDNAQKQLPVNVFYAYDGLRLNL